MPLVEVVGKGEIAEPEHTGETWVKVGVVPGLTVIVTDELTEEQPLRV